MKNTYNVLITWRPLKDELIKYKSLFKKKI